MPRFTQESFDQWLSSPAKNSTLLPAWLIFQATPALLAPRSRLENHLTAAQLEQKMDLYDMENTAAIDQSNSVHIIKQITKTHLVWTSTSEMLKQLTNPTKKWSHGACKPQFATRVGAPCIDVTPSRTSEAMSRATTCCLTRRDPRESTIAIWLPGDPPAWEQQNNKVITSRSKHLWSWRMRHFDEAKQLSSATAKASATCQNHPTRMLKVSQIYEAQKHQKTSNNKWKLRSSTSSLDCYCLLWTSHGFKILSRHFGANAGHCAIASCFSLVPFWTMCDILKS